MLRWLLLKSSANNTPNIEEASLRADLRVDNGEVNVVSVGSVILGRRLGRRPVVVRLKVDLPY